MLAMRWCMLLPIVLTQYESIFCLSSLSRGYTLLFDGGQQVNTTYNTYQGLSKRLRCASLCSQKAGCWMFMWDESSRKCHLLKELTTPITLMAAASTFQTFYVSAINGKKIVRTPTASSWTASRAACVNMGGRLFLPEDTTYSLILFYLINQKELWYGMYRNPNDTTVWYNMDGKVDFPKPNWFGGEPNNALGNQYYVSTWKGYLTDNSNLKSIFGVCEV